ncbi:1267_t:CDS:2 [Rhizophagus irregularis]|nr:1267_t:CDS:2 [Rhizophagus irregularis]
MSHAPCQFLKDATKILQIKGGGLKSHTKTRWSTMWNCINSIVRLEFALRGAVYRMPNQNIEFKNHCVIKFNERYDEFSDDLFLLAFFLHPRYHGNGINPSKIHNITVKAAQIWKNMGHDQESCGKLLSQMRKYMKNKAPFNQHYNYKSDTPIIWWETAQNTKEEWELQALALRLFAVSPHSASSVDWVEGMCKLHTYYITNAKRELPYYAVDTSECSLCEKMIDTLIEISDELVEDEVIVSQRRQTVVLDPEREDYDIEALIAKEMNDDNGSFGYKYSVVYEKFAIHIPSHPGHPLFHACQIFEPKFIHLDEWAIYCRSTIDVNLMETTLDEYWLNIAESLPLLSQIALDYIWLPISSCSVERSFSKYNSILDDNWQNLSMESLSSLNILYFNSSLKQ